MNHLFVFVDVSTLKLLRIHAPCSERGRPTALGFLCKMTKPVHFIISASEL